MSFWYLAAEQGRFDTNSAMTMSEKFYWKCKLAKISSGSIIILRKEASRASIVGSVESGFGVSSPGVGRFRATSTSSSIAVYSEAIVYKSILSA